MADDAHVLLVSPVLNEASHIERVVAAMARQSRPPDLWVVVDDGSTDGTLDLVTALAADVPFMRVLCAPRRGQSDVGDRLERAFEAQAFNWALRHVDLGTFTHVGKLDGDIELPPRYLQLVLAAFAERERLGLAGGTIEEPIGPAGAWVPVRVPAYHVHGALKLYSRACFEAIGGIVERLGWDTIDETRARMLGYETSSLSVRVRHHRPAGSAQGVLRGRARAGHCAYIVRYQPWWVALRSLEVARRRPIGVSALAFIYGYVRAAATRAWRVDDPAFKRFARAELRRRARHVVTRRAPLVRRLAHQALRKNFVAEAVDRA